MIAFDKDRLTEVRLGDARYAVCATVVPLREQAVLVALVMWRSQRIR
jgi:hypothetical protein